MNLPSLKMKKLKKQAEYIQYEYKHPYLGTEHFLCAILDNKQYAEALHCTVDEFRSEMTEVVGVGEKEATSTMMTPLMKNLYEGSRDSVMFIELLLDEAEGVAYRLLQSILFDKDLEIDAVLSKAVKQVELPPFCRELTAVAYEVDPAVARDDIIDYIERILLKINKPNILLVGDPGVGKTAIAEGLAFRINNNKCCDDLKDKMVIEVSTSSLVAGTRYRGEFEERVNKFIKTVMELDCILFFDEMHCTVDAGGAEGAISLSNILKPYLARGEIKMIGATTTAEYKKYMLKDKAYARRFSVIKVDEMSIDETIQVLKNAVPKFNSHFNVRIEDSVLSYIAQASKRVPGKNPDKSIDILEETCCKAYYNKKMFFSSIEVNEVVAEMRESRGKI